MNHAPTAYKLLVVLLYGRHSWLTRHPGGGITVPVTEARRVVGCRHAHTLRAALEHLAGLGLVTGVQWHGRWFVARTVPPLDMARALDAQEVLNVP
jgi:hypothetical protein